MIVEKMMRVLVHASTAAALTIVLATPLHAQQQGGAAPSGQTATPATSSVNAPPSSGNGVAILESFDKQQQDRVKQASSLSDQEKHKIMFWLAVPLILLLLVTAGLGIATGVYGKKLYIPHMVCAGLTVTLAIAHLVAGVVWFYPF